MARKVILDVDPGVGDALAICLALAEPDLELVAVTATGGNVTPRQASRNVQAVIEHLDPDLTLDGLVEIYRRNRARND